MYFNTYMYFEHLMVIHKNVCEKNLMNNFTDVESSISFCFIESSIVVITYSFISIHLCFANVSQAD